MSSRLAGLVIHCVPRSLVFGIVLLSFVHSGCTKESPPEPITETVDTTSHNINWQTSYVGDPLSTQLSDVAVINDTLAYAVGDIKMRDSSGLIEPERYNLLRWDGESWTPLRVKPYFRGSWILPPLQTIFAFDQSHIWLLVGALAIFGDGSSWTSYDVRTILGDESLDLQVCWGSDARHMYFAGPSGALVEYKDYTWRRIQTGTLNDINDIWGIKGSSAGTDELYCSVCNLSTSTGKAILHISGAARDTIAAPPDQILSNIWIALGSPLYVGGGWLWQQRGTSWDKVDIGSVTTSIRGTDANDVFATGTNGPVAHYNASTWHMYTELTGNMYAAVGASKHIVIAVGVPGVITIGRRN